MSNKKSMKLLNKRASKPLANYCVFYPPSSLSLSEEQEELCGGKFRWRRDGRGVRGAGDKAPLPMLPPKLAPLLLLLLLTTPAFAPSV